MAGSMLYIVCAVACGYVACTPDTSHELQIPGVELRLAHGVVFTYRNELFNSNDFESFSFVIPKFVIPTELFTRKLPCIYKGVGGNQPHDYHRLIHDVCVQVERLFNQHRYSWDRIVLDIERRLAEGLLPEQLPG